jgi:hypothetical protein
MIRKHPNVSDANFDILIDIAIKDAELTGYVSKDTLKQFYNLFSWVYIQGNTYGAFSKTLNLRSFFPGLICFDSRENQCAILRYCFTKS